MAAVGWLITDELQPTHISNLNNTNRRRTARRNKQKKNRIPFLSVPFLCLELLLLLSGGVVQIPDTR
jgi:hypothetical protein